MAIISRDVAISRRRVEKDAVLAGGAQMFAITDPGQLRVWDLLEIVMHRVAGHGTATGAARSVHLRGGQDPADGDRSDLTDLGRGQSFAMNTFRASARSGVETYACPTPRFSSTTDKFCPARPRRNPATVRLCG